MTKKLTTSKKGLYRWAYIWAFVWAYKKQWALSGHIDIKTLCCKCFIMPSMWAYTYKIITKQRYISLYIGHLKVGINNSRPIIG